MTREDLERGLTTNTEYTVEIYDAVTNNHIKQVDVFATYKEANTYCINNPLDEDKEIYSIWYIDYNDDGEEIDAGPVV